MHGMDLFAGIGGFSLGLKLAFGPEYRTVCYVERDDYCIQVIKARIADGLLDDAPIWDDIKSFDGLPWRGCVDIIPAGFPCQPYSIAGKGKGAEDERNLWPDLWRVIGEVEPRYGLLENVPGLLAHEYFGTILGELAEGFQDIQGDCLPASVIGANHQRDRLWILAESASLQREGEQGEMVEGWQGRSGFSERSQDVADASIERKGWLSIRQGGSQQAEVDIDGGGEDVADSKRRGTGLIYGEGRRQGQGKAQGTCGESRGKNDWWATEPDVGRVAHGVSKRVDRLKALGNAIVPAVVPEFLRLLNKEAKHENL